MSEEIKVKVEPSKPEKIQSEREFTQDKLKTKLQPIMKWAAYYRENPQIFIRDFMNISLKDFQKVIIWQMFHNNHSVFIGSRGVSKSYTLALYITTRCILYPGTNVVIAAGVKNQSNLVIKKIVDVLLKQYGWGSANIANEIKDFSTSVNNSFIEFHNGSMVITAVANDNARGFRANVLVVDEHRMVQKSILDTVLKRFLTSPRNPGYMKLKKYAHLQEPNNEIYCSSAWFQSHWSFDHYRTYFANLIAEGKKYYAASVPYQMAIKEGLLLREAVEDEMGEEGFNPTSWLYEMESLFYGASLDAFYDFEVVNSCRVNNVPFYTLEYYERTGSRPPRRVAGERRILSVDIALMASTKNKNDSSSLIINSAIPHTDTEFTSNIVYLKNHEGLTTDELGLEIMRTFYGFDCTDLVVDSNGVGSGVFDFLIKEQYDPINGKTYRAFRCINDDAMAERCRIKDANPCLWSIKANAKFNNEISVSLRNGFIDKRINLLVNEQEGEHYVHEKVKGITRLSASEQAAYKVPYIMTSMLIDELINLEHTYNDGKVKVFEKPGMRKDMYSSLAYNYYVVTEIQRGLKPKKESKMSLAELLGRQTKKSSLKIGF